MLGSAQAQTVSFSEAWSRVIQQDDVLAAEQAGVDRAKQLREAAKAMYLPKVDVGASYTHLDQPMELDMMDLNPIASHPEFGKVLAPVMQALNLSASDFVTPLTKQNVVTSSVKMLWPLFTGGRIDAAQDIRQAQVSEAQQLLVLKQQSTFESLSQTGGSLAAQVKVARLLSHGEALPQAAMGWNAVALNVLPVFNPTMGYVNYVVPAVFVLILHQVLLMGTGILGATQNQRSGRGEHGYWQRAPVLALLLARTLVVGGLFVLPVSYFFGFCFDHYNIVRTAEPAALWLFTLPFLLATTWLGVLLGALFTRGDLPTQVVLLSSMPLVFLAGFIWPLELIPTPLNWLAQWVPSTPAIEGFLRLNQMGADFDQVSRYWWQLWGLALLNGGLACRVLAWRQRSVPAVN